MPMSSREVHFYTEEEHEFGEWFYEQIKANIVVEESGWAFDSSQRVAHRLNQLRQGHKELEPFVIWIPDVIAFIVPGRYLYISRELLQRIPGEDTIAFLIAHEMAHHDLGHVRLFNYSWLRSVPGNVYLSIFLQGIKNKFASLEHESQADKHGLDLCLRAGYDGQRCLELFDILEAHLLDFRDLDGVFGSEEPEETSDKLLGGLGQWLAQTRQWSQQLMQSHPPLRSRKSQLKEHLNLYYSFVNENLGFKRKGIDIFQKLQLLHYRR